jgi:hypothetical protein
MTPPETSPGTSPGTSSEDLLRRAFESRADRVETAPDALSAIRTQVRRAARQRRRTTGFMALATAATVAVIFVVLGGVPVPAPQPPAVTPPVTPGPTASAEVPPAVRLPVYYAGTVGGKSVLYREFHDAPPTTSGALPGRISEAVRIVLTDRPFDPDYTSSWPAGVNVGGVTLAGGVAAIDLTGPAATVAPIAIQQLVWTATAVAADRGIQLDGVRLRLGGTQLGGGVLTRAPALDTLAPAWLISPQEGDTVGPHFDVHVSGAVPSGTVGLRVLNQAGTVVYETTITLSAQAPNRGEAHSGVDLPPGTYTLELHTPTASDTHHITVK